MVNFRLLKTFVAHEQLKKIVLTILASQMNEREIQDLKDMFLDLDKDDDGVLTIQEIR